MLAVDVGQNHWNEVNSIVKGGNYGWNIKEARHCFVPRNGPTRTACMVDGYRGEKLIDPVLEYMKPSSEGGAGYRVVGGYTYQGDLLPSMIGSYVFGDWSRSQDHGDGLIFCATSSGWEWKMEEVLVEE